MNNVACNNVLNVLDSPNCCAFTALFPAKRDKRSGCNKKSSVKSAADSTAPKGSKVIPVFPLKDSLVLYLLKALGGNRANFSLGIAKVLASKVCVTAAKACI